MKRLLLLFVICMSALVTYGQKNVTFENIGEFSALSLSGKLTVELIPAEAPAIDITLYDAEPERIKWNVDSLKLSVSLKSVTSGKGYAAVRIYYTKPVCDISVSRSELMINEPISADLITIKAEGNSEVTLSCDCRDIFLQINSSSKVKISGQTAYLTIKSGEKSNVDTRLLEATSVNVDAHTGADVYVKAMERFFGEAKSGASIFYLGNPEIARELVPKMSMGASITQVK